MSTRTKRNWSAALVPQGKTSAVGFKVSLSVQSETGQTQKFQFSQEKTDNLCWFSSYFLSRVSSRPNTTETQIRSDREKEGRQTSQNGGHSEVLSPVPSDRRCLGSEVQSDTRPSGVEQKQYKGGNRKSLLKCVENKKKSEQKQLSSVCLRDQITHRWTIQRQPVMNLFLSEGDKFEREPLL